MESFDFPLTPAQQSALVDACDQLLGSHDPATAAIIRAIYTEGEPDRQAMQALLDRLITLRYPSDSAPVLIRDSVTAIESANFTITPDEAKDLINACDITLRQYDPSGAAAMRAIYADGTPERNRLLGLINGILTLRYPCANPEG